MDLGVKEQAGTMEWNIEPSSGLMRITAQFRFDEAAAIIYANNHFQFMAGERIRLFFSYRYTANMIAELLQRHGLTVRQQWTTKSEEEGVFLCARA